MSTKKKTNPENAIQQAELILKLYELRREAVMREARSYVGGAFMPQSAEEFVEIVNAGGKQTGYVLQVYGYWDMVSAFVLHGALEADLVYDTCQEMYFQYAKIQPYISEIRDKLSLPEFLISIERVIEGSEASRARLSSMRKSLDGMIAVRAQTKAQKD